MRRLIAFSCVDETLVGTLDEASGKTGLLIVSGGNEVRAGAHRGMAALAAELAAGDVPVFRYDRRGVGDSEGENEGWSESADDLAAAVAAFRAEAPWVDRLIGFGNCDAATALALFGRAAGLDTLVLANPWTGDEARDGLPPPAAIRARYAARIADPRQWKRLMTGDVRLGTLLKGMRKAVGFAPRPLAHRIAAAKPALVILADRDATAQAFRAALPRSARDLPITTIDTASHSFAGPDAAAALRAALLTVLRPTR